MARIANQPKYWISNIAITFTFFLHFLDVLTKNKAENIYLLCPFQCPPVIHGKDRKSTKILDIKHPITFTYF
jgi:hypothetical protein